MTIINKVSNKTLMPGITPIPDVPDAPTIGTATAVDSTSATVTYTAAATGGAVTTFTATSTPGSITATGTSPITVTGLTASTAYTFTVKGTNATATGPNSAASNSITTAAAPVFDSIATVSISSDTNTITFSSIPSTYKHLQLRAVTRSNYNTTSIGQSQFKIQFNGDTGASYSYHNMYGNGTSVIANGASSQNQISGDQPWGNVGGYGAGLVLSPVIIDILDYQNTNKNKTVRILTGMNANASSTNQTATLRSGAWYSTSAITSITLDATGPNAFSDGPFAANTKWALYGIKG